MKNMLSVFCLVFLFGCVSSQPNNKKTHSLEGIWKPVKVEQNGSHSKVDITEDIAAVFENNTFEILADNKPIMNKFGIGNVRYTVSGGKLVIDSSTGEKFTADIEFFGPDSIRVSNFSATQEAAIIAMSIRAAATGKLIDNSTDWIKNSYIYLSMISDPISKTTPKQPWFIESITGDIAQDSIFYGARYLLLGF